MGIEKIISVEGFKYTVCDIGSVSVREAWIDNQQVVWAWEGGSKTIEVWFDKNEEWRKKTHAEKLPKIIRNGGAYGAYSRDICHVQQTYHCNSDEVNIVGLVLREFFGKFDYKLYCEREGKYEYHDFSY